MHVAKYLAHQGGEGAQVVGVTWHREHEVGLIQHERAQARPPHALIRRQCRPPQPPLPQRLRRRTTFCQTSLACEVSFVQHSAPRHGRHMLSSAASAAPRRPLSQRLRPWIPFNFHT